MSGTTFLTVLCIITSMVMKDSERLFNSPPPDSTIMAYDLFDKEHERNLENFQFRVSVYGILRQGDEILMAKHPDLSTHCLPGGGVEIGETIPEGLNREFEEETGLRVEMKRLLFVSEDFFTCEGEDAHGVQIYYEVKRVGGEIVKEGNQIDTAEVKFIKLSELNEGNVQRVFWPFIQKLKETPLLSVIVKHPIEAGKATINLIREVLDFEPRPGSDRGYEPRLSFEVVIERTVERVVAKKEG